MVQLGTKERHVHDRRLEKKGIRPAMRPERFQKKKKRKGKLPICRGTPAGKWDANQRTQTRPTRKEENSHKKQKKKRKRKPTRGGGRLVAAVVFEKKTKKEEEEDSVTADPLPQNPQRRSVYRVFTGFLPARVTEFFHFFFACCCVAVKFLRTTRVARILFAGISLFSFFLSFFLT